MLKHDKNVHIPADHAHFSCLEINYTRVKFINSKFRVDGIKYFLMQHKIWASTATVCSDGY